MDKASVTDQLSLRNGDGSKPWYLVNPKIAGKWMFIPLKMVLIGIDPYPNCIKKHGLVVECTGYTSGFCGFCGLVYHGLPLLEKAARASSIAKTVGPPHLGTPSCLNCEVGFCDVYEVSHKNLKLVMLYQFFLVLWHPS